MRVPFLFLALAVAMPGWTAPGLFDWGWQAPLADPTVWQVQPGWLSNVDATATVAQDGDALRFAVPTPGRGMKWSLRGVDAAVPGRGVFHERPTADLIAALSRVLAAG